MSHDKRVEWHNVGEESDSLCVATVGVTPEGKVFPVRCKKWACPVCAPINALFAAIKTANGVYALFAEGLRPKFATITQPGSIKTPAFAYAILDSQWDEFRNRWQYWARLQGIPNPYAAFVEGQSRREGMPHFHLIAAALPGKETVRLWATQSGFGFEADVQQIKANAGTAWYVSKYGTKGSDARFMPKNFRRVRYSRDWPGVHFRADLMEANAIVRQPRESYARWLVRAVQVYHVDPRNVMEQTQAIIDRTGNVERADQAAATLMQLEAWT